MIIYLRGFFICFLLLLVGRALGAAALQKYVGSVGGIGGSGVGTSAAYAPKELNKEITPEKVLLLLETCMSFISCLFCVCFVILVAYAL